MRIVNTIKFYCYDCGKFVNGEYNLVVMGNINGKDYNEVICNYCKRLIGLMEK